MGRVRQKSLPAEKLEGIRRSYENSGMYVRDLLVAHGISWQTLDGLIQQHGWKQRPRTAPVSFNSQRQKVSRGDARDYDPKLMDAVTTLQKQNWVVYRRGEDFMCGTKVLTPAALLEKAVRYGMQP
jgi:hypothetical protein